MVFKKNRKRAERKKTFSLSLPIGNCIAKNVVFNDEYLINYSTNHITTNLIRNIDLESSVHLFNFNNILTRITIRTNGKQENWSFGGHLDWCL